MERASQHLDLEERARLLADLIRDVPLDGRLEAQILHVFRRIEQQVRWECAEVANSSGHPYLGKLLIAAGPGGREAQRWESASAVYPEPTGGSAGPREAGGYRQRLVLSFLEERGRVTTGEVIRELGYSPGTGAASQLLAKLEWRGRVRRVQRGVWELVDERSGD